MKRRRSILLTIVALLLVVPLVLMMCPDGPLDLSKDEEPFRSMVLPPKSVTGDIIMDCGSVVVELIDAADKPYEIFFGIDYDTRGHPTAHWTPGKVGKRVPLKNPARAKAISKRLWSDYALNGDEGVRRALDYLSPISEIADRWDRKYRDLVFRWGF
jgi:hypothetical protein